MKLKHITESRGLLVYQRRDPQRVLQHPQIRSPLFKRSLGLRSNASEEDVLKAWKAANKVFEDYVSLLELANTDVLHQARKLELAQALLAANDLQPGMLAADPMMSTEQNTALREHKLQAVLGSGAFEDLEHYEHHEWQQGLSP